MKKVFYLFVIGAMVGFLGGCAGSAQQPAESEPLCVSVASQEIAMDAAAKVLRKMQFSIEKFDTDSSYLRTRPLSGAQFFEFWRQDNASSYQATQANIQSLRRTVEMEFSTKGVNTCIDCTVHVQRLSYPEQPISGMSEMSAAYTDSSKREQTLLVDQDRMERIEWIELEPDTALEKRLLDKIEILITKEQAK